MMRDTVLVAGLAALMAFASPLGAQQGRAAPARSATLPVSARGAAATVDAFHAALHRGDTRSAAGLLADDALIFEQGGAERSRAEYSAHHLPADAAFSQGVQSTVTRRSAAATGRIAWIATEGRTTGTYKGRPIDQLTTETMILRYTPRGWRIVHIHWSSAAAKKQ